MSELKKTPKPKEQPRPVVTSEVSTNSTVPTKKKSPRKQPKLKKEKLYVLLGNTKYNVIKRCAKSLGLKVTWDEKKDWDLVWHDTGVTADKVIKLMDYQRINHFPGMYVLARKNHLA